ncbi:MAG: hypothetical protein JWM31_2533, partial [Solirubrobacterales bacterium]|nr:hypothetical protein [Solirubrobacterales bacterium]
MEPVALSPAPGLRSPRPVTPVGILAAELQQVRRLVGADAPPELLAA